MVVSRKMRDAVRDRYNFACGYCGVNEVEAGSKLEIDHFQPISCGGTDESENLVYACTACNRNKASYWHSSDTPKLLHPLLDNLDEHISLLEDGSLEGLTARGSFHLDWLHLNRPQLIALRLKRFLFQRTQTLIVEMREMNQHLNTITRSQKEELDALREKVRLLRGE